MSRFSMLALLGLAAILVAGCQKRSESPTDDGGGKGAEVSGGPGAGSAPTPQEDPGDPPEKAGKAPPCFPETGPIAFKVDGVEVPKATVDRFLAVWTRTAAP